MQWTQEARYRPLSALSETEFEQLQQQVKNAPWRQSFHIQPLTGLLNDPNGFCFDGQNYHLFYQWFPLGPVHGLKYWRYLRSPDLVNFTDHGIGVAPDSLYDSHGAYSGSALANPDGNLLLAYTGNHRDGNWTRVPYQLLADFDPQNNALTRHEPFMNGPPEGYTEHVRDPKLWREGEDWYVVLGAQRENKTGCAIVVKNGEFLGELDCRLPEFGYMWECPDYFPLDGKDVLIISPQGLEVENESYRNIYQSGSLIGKLNLDSLTFDHHGFQELDHGFDFYAPQTCLGENGQRLLVAWMGLPDTTYPTDKDNWQGCLTLPRILSIEDGNLRQRPVPGLKTLRKSEEVIDKKATFSIGELILENPDNQPFTLDLQADESHFTRLSFDGHTLTLDRAQSGELPELTLTEYPAGKGGHIRHYATTSLNQLQLFLDHSSLEVFINDGEAVMTARLFAPTDANTLNYRGTGQLTAFSY